MAETQETDAKVYCAGDVQKILGLGRSSVYRFLDEVYENNRPFRIIRIGKLYRIPKEPFDQWLEGQGEVR